MASTETLQVKIIADASSLSKELSNVSKEMKTTKDNLEGLSKLGEGFTRVGKAVTGMGVAITGAISGIVLKGSEWQESVATTEFLYSNLDKSIQKHIDTNTENAKSIGLTERQYKTAQTEMSTFAKNMGFTTEASMKFSDETTLLAANLSAACNVPYSTVLEDIRSATLGNYEALDKYNLNLSASQLSQSEYAKSLGKTWDKMSDNEKMQCVLSEMTRQGGVYSGFAAQESESFASQLRILKEDIGDLVGALGQSLIPALEPVIGKIREVVDKIKEWVEQNPELAGKIMIVVGAIGLLMAIIGPILMGIGLCISAFVGLSGIMGGITLAAIGGVLLAFGQVIAIGVIVGLAIAAIIQIGQYLIENWDQIKQNAIDVWNNIKDTISQVVDTIVTTVKEDWEQLKSDGQRIWNDLKGYAQTIWQAIKDHIIQPVKDAWSKAQEIWNNLKTSCQNAWNTIKGYAQTAWNAVKTNIITPIQSAWSTVSSTVSNIVSSCQNAWNTVKGAAKSAWDAVKKAISDPINKARDAVKKAMDAIKRAVNVHLKPKLTLPHIKVSGKLSINPPSVPKISVECSAVA